MTTQVLSACCKATVGYDAWVDVNEEVVGGPYDESICMERGATNPDTFTVADVVAEKSATLVAALPDLVSVLKEFVSDVDAAYGEDGSAKIGLKRDWPDLLVTYARARAALAKAGVS